MSIADYQNYAINAATNAGLDPALFLSLIQSESGWNPNAVSSAGAVGLLQVMPSTAYNAGVPGVKPFNPLDPYASMDMMAIYFKDRIDKYGLKDGIAHYKGYKSYTQSDNSRTRVDIVIDGAKSFVDKAFAPIETRKETETITTPAKKEPSKKKLWDYTFDDVTQSLNAGFLGFAVGFIGLVIIIGTVWQLTKAPIAEVVQQ